MGQLPQIQSKFWPDFQKGPDAGFAGAGAEIRYIPWQKW